MVDIIIAASLGFEDKSVVGGMICPTNFVFYVFLNLLSLSHKMMQTWNLVRERNFRYISPKYLAVEAKRVNQLEI